MADDGKINYDEAQRQLREAAEMLQKIRKSKPRAPSSPEPEPPFCSFCGKARNEVRAWHGRIAGLDLVVGDLEGAAEQPLGSDAG